MESKQNHWGWWYGRNEESPMAGPFATRQDAINEAVGDGSYVETEDQQDVHRFYVLHAEQAPVRLADWIPADTILEHAEEAISESDRVCYEYDDGPWFSVTADQDADLQQRLKAACDEWQTAHGLVFRVNTFSDSDSGEFVAIPAEAEGGAA